MANVHALQHRICGHICAAGNRAELAHKLEHLRAVGYHQWRLRTVPAEMAAEQLAADEKCDTCRIDPLHGLQLLDDAHRCRVCKTRRSAPAGANAHHDTQETETPHPQN